MAFRNTTENKLRAYPIKGYVQPYWGVTSILSFVFGIPPELNRWSVKVAMQKVFAAEKLAKLDNKKLTQKERIDIAQKARQDYLESARLKGVKVHDHIEERIKTGKDPQLIDIEHAPYYLAFSKFLSNNDIEPILQETTVWDDENTYAGRIDFYGTLVLGGVKTRVLVDFKTSNFVKPTYGLQLVAYRHALELRGLVVDKMYVLHLQGSGNYELVEYHDAFEDFLNVRKVFRWKADREKPEFFWATDLGALKNELQNEKK